MKTKVQMLADAIALVEALDSEYYAPPVTHIQQAIRKFGNNSVHITDVRIGKDTMEKPEDRTRRLEEVQITREPIVAALDFLRNALAEANDKIRLIQSARENPRDD